MDVDYLKLLPDTDNSIGETNWELSQQATKCLFDHVEMLEEYISFAVEKKVEDVSLRALPVLPEGHEPSGGGLRVFSLRWATGIDWTKERSCIEGIYYDLESKIQHSFREAILFPSLSFLLITPRVGHPCAKWRNCRIYETFELQAK